MSPLRIHSRFEILQKPLLSPDDAQDGPAAALHARFVERIANGRRNDVHADDLLAVAGRADRWPHRDRARRAHRRGGSCARRSRALQCSDAAYADAVGLFQQAGFRVVGVADVPGMVAMRTVAMLANEAADTVNQGVCSPADLDLAMEKGVNYPCGPLAWADAIGLGRVHRVLSNLAASYGEDRYRVLPRIAMLHAAGRTFRS